MFSSFPSTHAWVGVFTLSTTGTNCAFEFLIPITYMPSIFLTIELALTIKPLHFPSKYTHLNMYELVG
jgi:hypothetical protein